MILRIAGMNPLVLIGTCALVATCAVALVLHLLSSDWVLRISNAGIGLQVAVTLVAFVLPTTMPRES